MNIANEYCKATPETAPDPTIRYHALFRHSTDGHLSISLSEKVHTDQHAITAF